MTEIVGRKTIDQLEPVAIPSNLDSVRIPVNINGQTVRITAQQIFDDLGGEVGEIRMYGGATAPAGWLICDGSALSRTNYARLFNVIGVRFGDGDGVNTYNIPDLIARMPMGADSLNNLLGSKKEAGLPNITGEFYANVQNRNTQTTGAFYQSASTSSTTGSTGGDYRMGYGFKASRSSAIYGNSNTVQPPATCVNFIIKY